MILKRHCVDDEINIFLFNKFKMRLQLYYYICIGGILLPVIIVQFIKNIIAI